MSGETHAKRIWQYAKSVEAHLPNGLFLDMRLRIVGGVQADLAQRVAQESTRLQRDLTEAELERILAEAGSPEQLAARHAGACSPQSDLVERYVAAVRRRLSGKRAADIVAELREGIGSRLEGLEAERGRAATREDVAAILKDYGPPGAVAAQFNGQDAVIGRDLLPWFWDAQRLMLGIVAAYVVLRGAIHAFAGRDLWQLAPQLFSSLILAGVFSFGAVTLVFMLLESAGAGASLKAKWDPRRLPADHVRSPKTLFEALFSLAAEGVFIAWWTNVIDFSNRIDTHFAAASFELSAAWDPWRGPILMLAVLSACVHLADLVYPAWSRPRAVISVLAYGFGVLIAAMLLKASPLLDVTAVGGESPRIVELATTVNRILFGALAVTMAVWMGAILVEVARFSRSLR